MTLSGPIPTEQSGLGSNGNEGVFRIRQTSWITGDSSSCYLVSYQRHSLCKSCISAEMQSVYSEAPANWRILLNKYESVINWGLRMYLN